MSAHRDQPQSSSLSKGLRASWDAYAIVIAVRDSRGQVVDFSFHEANDLARAILALSREELLDEKVSDILSAECAPTWIAWLTSVVESEESTGLLDISLIRDATATARRVDARAVSDGDVVGFTFREETSREEAARRVEEHYRFLATFNSDVVWVERAGVIDWVSAYVKTLLLWRSSDVVGRSVIEFVHPEDKASLENLYGVDDSSGSTTLTLRIQKADGEYRWVSMQSRESVDSISRTGVRVSSMLDAEAEVAARKALLASERRYRLLAENVTDVVIECDENGVIGWVSPSTHAVLQWQNDRTVGTQLLDHVFDVDRERFVMQQTQTDVQQRVSGVAIRYSTSAQDVKWMSQDMRRYRGNEGQQFVYLVTLRDIDENVSLRSALQDSRARFELLAENASDVVYVVDLEGRLLWVSPSVAPELGWQVGDIIGHNILDLIFEEDHPRVIAWRQLLHFGENLDSLTIRVRHASGHFVWVKVRARATRDNDGHVTGVVVSLRNFDAEVSNLYALRTISAVGRLLVREKDPLRMLRQICQVAVEEGGYALSFFARRNYDEGKSVDVVAASTGHETYIEDINLSWGPHAEGQGPAGRAIRLGQASTIADADIDPTFQPWRESAHAHGFRSVAAIPIIVNGEIQGTWQLYAPEYGAFVPEVLSVLEALAIDIGYALARADSDWLAVR